MELAMRQLYSWVWAPQTQERRRRLEFSEALSKMKVIITIQFYTQKIINQARFGKGSLLDSSA